MTILGLLLFLVLLAVALPIVAMGGEAVVDIAQELAKPINMRGANNISNPEWRAWHEKYPWTPAERDNPDAWRYAKAAEEARAA